MISIMSDDLHVFEDSLIHVECTEIAEVIEWAADMSNLLTRNNHSDILTFIEGYSDSEGALSRLKRFKLILKKIYDRPEKYRMRLECYDFECGQFNISEF